jgi:hypothetical protein
MAGKCNFKLIFFVLKRVFLDRDWRVMADVLVADVRMHDQLEAHG